MYTSFTGKATQVLQKKGNKNAKTLHKLLFKSTPRLDGTFYRKPVDFISYKIVVVDECSMVPKELLDQLFKHDTHILCLGDPAQLPPINKNEDNHLLDNPHIFLDEVMRQAQESEIIKLTMDIRAGKPLTHFQGKEVQILNKNELTTGMLTWADQIICSTNNTRQALNSTIRKMLGYESEYPQEGDKVICLKNNWNIVSKDENPLVNGTIGYLHNIYDTHIKIPHYVINTNENKKLDFINAKFITDTEDTYNALKIDKQLLLTNEFSLNSKETYYMRKSWKYKELIPEQFAYGYAITCHKSQGSE